MNLTMDLEQGRADDIIERLRFGNPSHRDAELYSAGQVESFLDDVRKQHLESPSRRGKIRFINGSWGSGKTHLLRRLREEAFLAGYLVSNVELDKDQAPFNKFEKVFYKLISNLASPEMYKDDAIVGDASFGPLLQRILFGAKAGPGEVVSSQHFQDMNNKLFSADGVDIDFRRIISSYWKTFLPGGDNIAALEEIRGELLKWFEGEGTVATFRKKYGVQKTVNRTNARLMLQSLSRFALQFGYHGILILLDETAAYYSGMRKSNLTQAHNNLLHLINGIDESEGLFLVYAATPDFFIDPDYGILRYGALVQRIGKPEEREPRALDRVWNLDELAVSVEDFQEAASKVRQIYMRAHPEVADNHELISDDELKSYVADLKRAHPRFSRVSAWRVIIPASVQLLEATARGEKPKSAEDLHDEIIKELPAD
jgi:hypothetical protein